MVGGLASLALLAAAVAVCAPLVVKRLRAHAPAADEAARRVEAAVTQGLDSVGRLADAAGSSLAPPARVGSDRDAAVAALPDGPTRAPGFFPPAWCVPVDPVFLPPAWGGRSPFWKPFFPRPAPWYFHRHPLWRPAAWRRK
jgi:hypothetical protein